MTELDDFVLLTVLAFDDGTLSVQMIQRGTKESCIAGADMIDAISYSGSKRVVESCVRWMPHDVYQEALQGRCPQEGRS